MTPPAHMRAGLDRYTAPNENPVPTIGREPYSDPRRAERAERRQSHTLEVRA
jgi:hypothetical protein